MEEEPVMCVPDPEKEQQDFIIEQDKQLSAAEVVADAQPSSKPAPMDDEMTLDDISAAPLKKSREEIIAEAEAQAFSEA